MSSLAPWEETWTLHLEGGYIEVGPGPTTVCRRPMWVRADEGDQVARIKLASAAPELYRALVDALYVIENCLEAPHQRADRRAGEAMALAKAAMAKARGDE